MDNKRISRLHFYQDLYSTGQISFTLFRTLFIGHVESNKFLSSSEEPHTSDEELLLASKTSSEGESARDRDPELARFYKQLGGNNE